MQLLGGSIAALVVSLIFLLWQNYSSRRQQRERTLRQRVAYMLWVMAQPQDEPAFAGFGASTAGSAPRR